MAKLILIMVLSQGVLLLEENTLERKLNINKPLSHITLSSPNMAH